MIEVFADESGKLNDGHFLCFCGFVLDDDRLESFDEEWRKLLGRDNRAYIHVNELTYLGETELNRRLADYVSTIRNNLNAIISVGLDVDYYRRMERPKQQLLGKRKPMLFCFARLMRLVLMKIAEWEAQRGAPYPDGSAALIFDDDEEYSVKCYRLYATIRRERADVKRLFSIFSAADDKFAPALQAADVIAWYTNKDLRRRLVSGTPLGTSDPASQPPTFKSELYDGPGLENTAAEILRRSRP
jgi:hypothetical protein